jgi:hypothetical protein
MPPLTDPERLRCYRNALKNWNYTGCIRFKERAWAWLTAAFPGLTQRQFAQLLHRHIKDGGEIDEQVETREEWRKLHEFHHDLRILFKGRRVYFETRLVYRNPNDPDDPFIEVVNAHDA